MAGPDPRARSLKALGTFTQPAAPPPPRRPAGSPGAAERQVPAPPPAPLAFLAPWLEGAVDAVRGGLWGSEGAGDTAAAKTAELLAAGLPLLPLKALGFFSRVDKALDLIPAKGAHPNKIASLLKSNASAEELAYRNVPEFLAGKGNATVTRAELAAHLAAHPAPVPVVKTRMTTPDRVTDWLERNNEGLPQTPDEWTQLSARLERTAQGWQRNGDPETANRFFGFAEDAGRHAEGVSTTTGSTAGQPRHARWQVPGGENYRETLVTLPSPPAPNEYELQSAFTQANEDLNAFRSANPDAELQGLADPEYRRLVLARNRLGEQLTASENAQAAQQYVHRHYPDDPNIVVHTRANERTLPTGERGRFIEEVQSDWHQTGKEQGYRASDADAQAMASRMDAIRAEKDRLAQQRDPRTKKMLDEPRWHELSREYEALIDRYNRTVNDAVPDAPFKENWQDLGLKQQVLETAAVPNAEWIGFTGGATQAARYDLSKQVSHIDYRRTKDGLFELGAVGIDGDPVSLPKSAFSAEELPAVVGKELAEKIVAGQGQSGGGRMTLRGVDLQVGGEGMEHFYDRLLPKRLEKILKPFGGTVERGTLANPRRVIQRDGGWFVEMGRDAPDGPFPTRAAAEAHWPASEVPAWFAKLTPEMKARILKEGLPLMSLLPLGVLGTYGQPPQEPAR